MEPEDVAERLSDLDAKVSELETNLGLAGEAIGSLLWLVEELAEKGELS